jgi:hypothetical protein
LIWELAAGNYKILTMNKKTSKAIYSGEIPAIFTYNHTIRN